ncbi:hexosaminidase D-like [Dendronephthya gigantea]|uniref:hexosaminidase D-like n=1 Tax=Dendronephthya gigantea TaxID=151771 RepID=UPI00106CBA1F|nr:hexosaminidase D-like [Dendronephthya gigantea]
METRVNKRVVITTIVGLAFVFLLLSTRRSKNSQSDSSSLIAELKEKLWKKENEIDELQVKHQVEIKELRKSFIANSHRPKLPSQQSRNSQDYESSVIKELREKLRKKENIIMNLQTQQDIKISNVRPNLHIKSRSFNKLVHLDLKGSAPKMDYILKLLSFFKSWGATGLLVEYEDMFPYDGEISVLKSHYAYSLNEITMFLKEVQAQQLLLVPLVQTFGHMEFVLKHPKFAHLRHVANMTTAIDPNNRGSLPLVKMMVNQIVRMHKGYIKYLHIGGDEVWSLKACSGCNVSAASEVYMKHMLPVIDHVVSNQVTPILWDDMMRRWNVDDLKNIAARAVQPMIWAYPARLDKHFPPGMWNRYSEAFSKVWIASAFKGADTPYTNFVPIQDRIDNHKSWLKILSMLSTQNVKVNGIALTGWSRYDHYATMCELLPAGLPSLALCLAVLKEGDLSNQTLWAVSQQLGFKSPVLFDVYDIPRDLQDRDEGRFLGHSVYGLVLTLQRAYNALASVEKRMPAWFNQRQFAQLKISFFQLTISLQRIESATMRLKKLTKLVDNTFSKFYNDDTINEWIWDKIKNKLSRAEELKQHLMKIRTAAREAEQRVLKPDTNQVVKRE